MIQPSLDPAWLAQFPSLAISPQLMIILQKKYLHSNVTRIHINIASFSLDHVLAPFPLHACTITTLNLATGNKLEGIYKRM